MRVADKAQSLTRIDPCVRALYPSMVLVVGISVLWLLRGEHHEREEISTGTGSTVQYYTGSVLVEKTYSRHPFSLKKFAPLQVSCI